MEPLSRATASDAPDPGPAAQGAGSQAGAAVTPAAAASRPVRQRPSAASAGSGGQPAVKLSGASPQHTARFVAIAGNIGAGKSTLTSFLESRFAIKPFYEPNDSNPYLTDFYSDMARYAFHSQMYFLSAKFRAHLELGRMLAQQPRTVFVQDRTIYEDAEIFARTLHTRGVMSARDFQTYQGMYHGIRDTLPRPDLLIYLRCSLRGLRRRIRARGRPEEQAMSPRYLADLQDAYEDWFARYDLGPTLVIETEQLDYLANLIDRVELVTALEQLVQRA